MGYKEKIERMVLNEFPFKDNTFNLLRLICSFIIATGHIFYNLGFQESNILDLVEIFPGVPVFLL